MKQTTQLSPCSNPNKKNLVDVGLLNYRQPYISSCLDTKHVSIFRHETAQVRVPVFLPVSKYNPDIDMEKAQTSAGVSLVGECQMCT